MRTVVILCGLFFVGLWGFVMAVLSGNVLAEPIHQLAPGIQLPTSTAELGDSLGIFNGLLSSLAVLLALAAVVFQGQALRQQNVQHERALKVSAMSTRLQFLNAEVERLGAQADSLDDQIQDETDADRKKELFNIMRNSRKKQFRLRDEAQQVNDQLTAMLEKISG